MSDSLTGYFLPAQNTVDTPVGKIVRGKLPLCSFAKFVFEKHMP